MTAKAGCRGTVAERFEKYSIPEPNSGCLLWCGSVDRRGYGQLRVDGKLKYATHIALSLAGRPLAPNHRALHHCDNPGCVEAVHLFAGTQADNVYDMMQKGRDDFSGLALGRRGRPFKTYCRWGHPLSGQNLYVAPSGARHCKECKRLQKQGRAHAAA